MFSGYDPPQEVTLFSRSTHAQAPTPMRKCSVQRGEISKRVFKNIEGTQCEVGGDSTNDMETPAILEEDGEFLVNNASRHRECSC